MAVGATAVWRIRPNGNDLNGAGYDAAYAGGTDYSQQDAAQATFTATLSTSAANSTTLLNSANTFTSAMVGNAVRLASGTNGIVGYYFITAFASAGSVTIDRTPATAGALAAGTGRLGGAGLHWEVLTASSNNWIVAGNQVLIYTPSGTRDAVTTTLSAAIASTSATSMSVASATGFPSSGAFYALVDSELVRVTAGAGTTTWTITRAQNTSAAASHTSGATVTSIDYAINSGPFNTVSGSTSAGGRVQIVGQNGRPASHVQDRLLDTGSDLVHFASHRFYCGPNANQSLLTSSGTLSLADLYINTFDPSGVKYSRVLGNPGRMVGCEIESGSLSPATGTSPYVVDANGGSGIYMDNVFRGMPGVGFSISGGSNICVGNVVYKQGNTAFLVTGGGYSDQSGILQSNTADGCILGDGISFDTAAVIHKWRVANNIVSNNVGASKVGLRIAGNAALNDTMLGHWGPNVFYNNTANTSGCSVRAVDVVGIDPAFTSAATGDHSIGPALKGAGSPTTKRFATTSYSDPGAVQRQEPTAVSSVLRRPSLQGVG